LGRINPGFRSKLNEITVSPAKQRREGNRQHITVKKLKRDRLKKNEKMIKSKINNLNPMLGHFT
jgi:hypothetical protein